MLLGLFDSFPAFFGQTITGLNTCVLHYQGEIAQFSSFALVNHSPMAAHLHIANVMQGFRLSCVSLMAVSLSKI
jgi:hypothetical protein